MTLEAAILGQLAIDGQSSAERLARVISGGPTLLGVGRLLRQLRREGIVSSRPGTGLWELTPAGFQRAHDEAEARLSGGAK